MAAAQDSANEPTAADKQAARVASAPNYESRSCFGAACAEDSNPAATANAVSAPAPVAAPKKIKVNRSFHLKNILV